MPRYRPDTPGPARPARHRLELDLAAIRGLARSAWERGEALAEAGDLRGACAWLGRAHRIAPHDQNLRFALASALLRAGEAAQAADLFGAMAERFDVGACWTGLASALLRTRDPAAASAAIARALSGHAADAVACRVADEAVRATGGPGWCGVRADGVVLSAVSPGGGQARLTLDGAVLAVAADAQAHRTLPAGWRTAQRLGVTLAGQDLLGSPVRLQALRRVEGFVARTTGGIEGWAWHPRSPDLAPDLTVTMHPGLAGRSLTARDPAPADGTRPLARPRAFHVPAPDGAEIHVLGSDGRHLLGSPLPALPAPAPAARPAAAPRAEPDLPVDVVVPVHRGAQVTLACLASVMRTVAAPHRIVVVDDASPEPELVAALDGLAASGAIGLLRPDPPPGGFPRAVNAALAGAEGRHVLLLNSDTLVAPGWLERLRDAACSAADIGTATPLSNEASIFSYPDAAGGNPAPDAAGTAALAALAARANAGLVVDVPTAHGFCMFIRRDCLAATGPFEDALFAQGYGEENDFSERARALGYRHVAVPAVFVAHRGGTSFGGAGGDLLARNLALLRARHPDYAGRVAGFVAADPLFPARRRLDAARFRAAGGPSCSASSRSASSRSTSSRGSVLLVTHGGGGGTARVVAERARAAESAGLRPIVLGAREGRLEVGDASGGTPNLAFQLPAERAALRRLLAAERPVEAELHHLLGHDHAVLALIAELGIPYDAWVHDYAWFCARLSFLTGDGRFCGEAPASTCVACLARWGREIEDPIEPAALRRRSAADLLGARRIVVPSADVARRVARHVPGARPAILPWEKPPDRHPAAIRAAGGGRRRVAVIGAIGVEKGIDVLQACAADAAARDLALEFVVVGYTSADAALLATGRAFVTGEFRRDEAARLIAAQDAHLAFLPSIWPETWCYALSDAWAAGLSAAVFDIGTPAERVRDAGRGWVLPLGLPPPRVNDVLLTL